MAVRVGGFRTKDRNTVEQGGGTVTHGAQLTKAMVGPRIATTIMSGAVSASDFGVSGVTISGKHFTGSIAIDIDCTLEDCYIEDVIQNSGGHTVQLNWCTVSPPTPGDRCIGPYGVSAYRCLLEGCSDGVGLDTCNLIENFITLKGQSSLDHNDGAQSYIAGAGGQVLRNNINGIPVNTDTLGLGQGNSCIFVADNSQGTLEIRDNLLTGGGYTLGLHDSMFYRVTGNRVTEGSWGYGPVNTQNAVSGAFLEWSDNLTTGGTVLSP